MKLSRSGDAASIANCAHLKTLASGTARDQQPSTLANEKTLPIADTVANDNALEIVPLE